MTKGMKHYHSSYYGGHGRERGGLFGSLSRLLAMAILVVLVGGLTWLALTPDPAPTETVTRPVAADKLGPL